MGFDMYAFVTDEQIPAVDFDRPKTWTEFCYWCDHFRLHGWMERLYRAKGGRREEFNRTAVRLDEADLEALERAVNTDTLPQTGSFLFGVSEPEKKQEDLDFVQQARVAIKSGRYVYYIPWW